MKEQFTINEQKLRLDAQKDGISRISAGAGIGRGNRLLLVRRSADDFLGGLYELPGGGVDEGESIETALTREVKEELGLIVTKVQGMFTGFDYGNEKREKTRQFNFVVEVEEGDIVLSPEEHDEYIWVSYSDVGSKKVDLTQNIEVCIKDYFKKFQ